MKRLLLVASMLTACSGGRVLQARTEGACHGLRVLLVLAHPDDETMIGGLLGRLEERSIHVTAVYATDGEGGVVHRPDGRGGFVETRLPSAEMRRIRMRELTEAAERYGVDRIVRLRQPDAAARDDEDAPTDGWEMAGVWDRAIIEAELVEVTRDEPPDAVITLGRARETHVHHRAIATIARGLFARSLLGPRARQLYELDEAHWYDAETFDPFRGKRDLMLRQRQQSPELGMSYGEFQVRGARAYESQPPAYQTDPADEVLRPLTERTEDPLRAWIEAEPRCRR